jgi:hypothetical protein
MFKFKLIGMIEGLAWTQVQRNTTRWYKGEMTRT